MIFKYEVNNWSNIIELKVLKVSHLCVSKKCIQVSGCQKERLKKSKGEPDSLEYCTEMKEQWSEYLFIQTGKPVE